MDVESYRKRLSAFEVANAAVVERIVDELVSRLPSAQEEIDDLVVDCAVEAVSMAGANESVRPEDQESSISSGEAAASEINNEGFRVQVACILEGFGLEEGESRIRKAFGQVHSP